MLERAYKHKDVITKITTDNKNIPGLTQSQRTKLSALKFDNRDWCIIESLKDILQPFYFATKLMSGRSYNTLSLSFVVKKKS
jgi:hypothetical protein